MTSLDKIIQDSLESYPLTGMDIINLLKGKTNVMKYNDLENLALSEILGKHKACVILYEYPNQEVGHWTALFEHPDGSLEYFNSFAYGLDYNPSVKTKPILATKLIGYKVIVNTNQLQSKKSDVNTCGRHCVARLAYRHLQLKDFVKLLTTNKSYNPDFWSCVLTTIFV